MTARITEWQPTTPTDVPGILFWGSVALVAAAVLVIARRRRTVPWPALLALVAFAALGAVAARGIAWWPLVAVVTDGRPRRREPRVRREATAPSRSRSWNRHAAGPAGAR